MIINLPKWSKISAIDVKRIKFPFYSFILRSLGDTYADTCFSVARITFTHKIPPRTARRSGIFIIYVEYSWKMEITQATLPALFRSLVGKYNFNRFENDFDIETNGTFLDILHVQLNLFLR